MGENSFRSAQSALSLPSQNAIASKNSLRAAVKRFSLNLGGNDSLCTGMFEKIQVTVKLLIFFRSRDISRLDLLIFGHATGTHTQFVI